MLWLSLEIAIPQLPQEVQNFFAVPVVTKMLGAQDANYMKSSTPVSQHGTALSSGVPPHIPLDYIIKNLLVKSFKVFLKEFLVQTDPLNLILTYPL